MTGRLLLKEPHDVPCGTTPLLLGNRRETRQPLRTPILLLTALLFVTDVFLRRVRLRRD